MNKLPIIRSLAAPVALGACRLALLAVAPLLSIPAAAETMIFQADRDNTMVGGANANSNFGTAENLSAGTVASADQITTISFDVSGPTPFSPSQSGYPVYSPPWMKSKFLAF